MEGTDRPTEHLTAQELAAFVDRQLPNGDRRRVAIHLTDCEQCRVELSGASAVLGRDRSRRRRVAWIGSLVAAAVVAALVLVPGSVLGPGGGDESRIRGGGPEGTALFEAASPGDGEIVSAADLVFIWRPAGPEARYELTITDFQGDPVWTAPSSDTLLAFSPDVTLIAGATYYWYVDALLDGARSATTVFRRFTVQP